MNNLTFFAKKRFFSRGDRHLMRGSSIIRGVQIAQYLGAKLNPLEGYEDDVCIYVKPHTGSLYRQQPPLAKNAYIDVVDGWNIVMYLQKNPDIPVIACSRHDYELFSSKLKKSKVYFIPQQNCNFERFVSPQRGEIKTIGIIGSPSGTKKQFLKDFQEKIENLGLKLWVYTSFKKREDVLNFYKEIDLQLVWRPFKTRTRNPLKIVNSASFGVPTVALDEEAFGEVEGCYFPVKNEDEAVEQIKELMGSPQIYDECSKRCLAKGEEYHISKIAELYKKLEKYA